MKMFKSFHSSSFIPQPSSFSYAWVILAVIYLASVVAPFNQYKAPPVLPVLMESLQIDLAQAGALMSIVAVIGLILALPAGLVIGRFGPKITALVALASLAFGSGLGALSGSFSALLVSRVIEGIGMGLIGVAAPATIAMWFPPERQGAPMGIWATWVPVGSLVVYNLAPQMAASLGWKSVWWVGLGYALVMIFFSALLLRRPPSPRSSPEHGSAAPGIADLRIALSNRDIWLLAVEFACFNLALIGLATYYPTFLNEVRGYPLGQAALLTSVSSLVVLASSPLSGLLSDRIGSRRLLFSIPFLAIGLLLVFPFRATGWQIVAVMVIQGILMGAIPTATFAAAPEIMRKPHWAGFGLAAILAGQNLGQLAGPLLFGRLANQLGWAAAGYFMIPICLLGFLSAWRVRVR